MCLASVYDYYDTSFWVGILIGSLIGCTIWGFVVRYIMKNKGYTNLGTWFVCGFFLGIIGLVIAITRPDLRNQPFQNGNPYGSPYGNPYANPYGQPMQPPYPNQPYQNGMQPPYPPNAPYGMPNQPMPNQQGVRCQSCGMMNAPGSTFCAGCGNKMN
ncbi:MAG: hypothetical protein ILA24_01930 [Ruminococcus sp.]|nr:hypothetical protein [Ruminococcus sp.]